MDIIWQSWMIVPTIQNIRNVIAPEIKHPIPIRFHRADILVAVTVTKQKSTFRNMHILCKAGDFSPDAINGVSDLIGEGFISS